MPVRKRSESRSGNDYRRSNGRSGNRSGQTDAITLLKQDHAAVKKLLKRLESSEDASSREELRSQVEMQVKIHTQIEEELFYPAFKDAARSEKDQEIYFEAMGS